jgi:hypothetical protein
MFHFACMIVLLQGTNDLDSRAGVYDVHPSDFESTLLSKISKRAKYFEQRSVLESQLAAANFQVRKLQENVGSFCKAHPEHQMSHLCHQLEVGGICEPAAAAEKAAAEKAAEETPGSQGNAAGSTRVDIIHTMPTGEDVCKVLQVHCGTGRAGALCLKNKLEQLLRSDSLVQTVRDTMQVPLQFYFLCSERDYAHLLVSIDAEEGLNSPRVRALSTMLHQAVQSNSSTVAKEQYYEAAKWSALANWTTAEKVAHYLTVLQVRPDDLHCIDRLSVALGEGHGSGRQHEEVVESFKADGAATKLTKLERDKRQSRAQATMKAKVLLLHYSVLRRLIAHPMQRPMSLERGLSARPIWHPPPSPPKSGQPAAGGGRGGGDDGAGDSEVMRGAGDLRAINGFEWAIFLQEPDQFRVMQQELLVLYDARASNGGSRNSSNGGSRNSSSSCSSSASRRTLSGKSGQGEEQGEGIHSGSWQEIDLVTEGQINPEALIRVPKTIALLKRAEVLSNTIASSAAIAGAGTEAGTEAARAPQFSFINARLSTLGPDTHITPHCGISNAKLRAHLGLRVPIMNEHRSEIRVAEEIRQWQEGGFLIFDDSFEHEVWWQHGKARNAGGDKGGERVVLILDIFHPQLPEERRKHIRADFVRSRAAQHVV